MKSEILGINSGPLEHDPILWEPEYRAGGMHIDIPISHGSVWMLAIGFTAMPGIWEGLGRYMLLSHFWKD